jgi:hypothetical protein
MQIASLFALVLVVGFVLLRLVFPAKSKATFGKANTRRLDKADRRSSVGADNPFHAVSVHPSAISCLAAETIKGQRFLSEQAPALPLEACTVTSCNCRYVHHVDRRRGNGDRRGVSPAEEGFLGFAGSLDRRGDKGRRASDWVAA